MANISPSDGSQGTYWYLGDTAGVNVRTADLDDLPGILRIEDDCFGAERFNANTVQAFLERDDTMVIVATIEGDVVGAAMCIYSPDVQEGRIASIAVLRRLRGHGIGARLLEECERRFLSEGLERFTLEVEIGNEPAISLYLTRGYEIKSMIRGYYSGNRDAYHMEKSAGEGKEGIRILPS